MTKERIRTKDNREINIVDFLIEILIHWRLIIIFAVIGGVLLGGYGFYSTRKARFLESQVVAQSEPQPQLSKEELLTSIKARLSAKDIATINTIIDNYRLLQMQNTYLERSVLMKADPFNMPEGSVVVRVNAEPETITDIYSAFIFMIPSADMFEVLTTRLGLDDTINEQIVLVEKGGIDEDHFTIKLNFYALSEEDCSALQDAFIDYVKEKSAEYTEIIGPNEVFVIDQFVSVVYDPAIADAQRKVYTAKKDYENNITTNFDGLSADGKTYYNLYMDKIDAASLQPTQTPEVNINTGFGSQGTKKLFIYGVAGGLFVSLLLISLMYIFTNKLRDTDSFNTVYGINQIGKIFRPSKKEKYSTIIDRAFYSLKRRGRKKVELEEAINNAAVSTTVTAVKIGAKKIGIFCLDKDEKLSNRMVETLSKKDIDSIVLCCPLKFEDVASDLIDVEGAVIVAKSGISRYYDVWDIIDMLEAQNVRIIGGIMA